MLSLKLEELSQSKYGMENKLSEQDMYNIKGNGLGSVLWRGIKKGAEIARDGALYDLGKAGVNWTKDNVFVGP